MSSLSTYKVVLHLPVYTSAHNTYNDTFEIHETPISECLSILMCDMIVFRAFVALGVAYLDENVVHWSESVWGEFLLQCVVHKSMSINHLIVNIDTLISDYLRFYKKYIEDHIVEMFKISNESREYLLLYCKSKNCKIMRKDQTYKLAIMKSLSNYLIRRRPVDQSMSTFLKLHHNEFYKFWFLDDEDLLRDVEKQIYASNIPWYKLIKLCKWCSISVPKIDSVLKHDLILIVTRYICHIIRNILRSEHLQLTLEEFPKIYDKLNDTAQEILCDEWLETLSNDIILSCCESYRQATCINVPNTCDSCLQSTIFLKIETKVFGNITELNEYLSPIHINDSVNQKDHNSISDFYDCCHNDWSEYYIVHSDCMSENVSFHKKVQIRVCTDCTSALNKCQIPKFNPKNNLFCSKLPDELHDLNWVEEKACAIYHASIQVTRSFGSTSTEEDPLVLHGNMCAHAANVISTAEVLLRSPADVRGMISVVFAGSRKPSKSQLKHQFLVRKHKIINFLYWLKNNNALYKNVQIDESVTNSYPDEDVLPGLYESMVVDIRDNAFEMFQKETAGMDEHPASNFIGDEMRDIDDTIYLEKMGTSDPNGSELTGRSLMSSALRNLWGSCKDNPDIIILDSENAIVEYKNPNLLPGMFPTLFPNGLAGFEDNQRMKHISFRAHAQYLLELKDTCFHHHQTFLFVVFNIIQQREAHLNVHFTTHKSNFSSLTGKLCKLTPALVDRVTKCLTEEKSFSEMSKEQLEVVDILKQLNASASKIPGSQTAKVTHRNVIKSFVGYFGIPHIYLTMNPNAVHSPIFQIFVGNESIDLNDRYPELNSRSVRAIQVAKDPVAASLFFQFSIEMFFEHLLGWNFKKKKSKPEGGILGKVNAYVGSSEYTHHGGLHAHMLIVLLNALSPSEVRYCLQTDDSYLVKFSDFFDSIIKTGLPLAQSYPNKQNLSCDPRTTRPIVFKELLDVSGLFTTEGKNF
jgi:hypothetical protein